MRCTVPSVSTALLALILCGCSREPTVPTAWLGPVVAIPAPAATGATFPRLAGNGDQVVLSWLEPHMPHGTALRHAEWRPDHRWTAPRSVDHGDDWLVNWADFPAVVPLDRKLWAAYWPRQRHGHSYAYDAVASVSTDGGGTWSAPFRLHDDDTPTEHGFVSLASIDAAPVAIWLDGRRTADGRSEEGHDAHSESDGAHTGAMTLRSATLDTNSGTARAGVEIDTRVCDCCGTAAARTADAVVLVYRDRSDDEVRDIHAVRYAAGRWSSPIRVHRDGWRIAGCPVNGPAIAAAGNDVAVAWFTAPDVPRIRVAFSSDGGRSFEPALEVASGRVVGRVAVVLDDERRAIVSWMQESTKGAALQVQPFSRAGPDGPPQQITSVGLTRSSGFPQMARVPGGLVFAWTEQDPAPTLHTAFAPLD
jgi:hypothetical protein